MTENAMETFEQILSDSSDSVLQTERVWLDRLMEIEELEDADFDPALVAELQGAAAAVVRPIRFSTPTFKDFESSELQGCSKNSLQL